jgi:hypothetical protein
MLNGLAVRGKGACGAGCGFAPDEPFSQMPAHVGSRDEQLFSREKLRSVLFRWLDVL